MAVSFLMHILILQYVVLPVQVRQIKQEILQ